MPVAPSIATFPRDDRVFAAFVQSSLAAMSEERCPGALEAQLRRWHTRAIVRVQADLAGFGWGETWYVYRDGRAGIVEEPDWWLDPECAHVGFGRDGVFVATNAAADALVGRETGLVGRHWSELLAPVAQGEDAAFLWELLDQGQVAHSVFDLPLRDGGHRVIEYRSVRCPEGGYESWWRELAVLPAAV